MALEPGDHVWYFDGQGNDKAVPGEQTSTDKNIPRMQWFPGADANDPNSYGDNGTHIFNFVVYDGPVLRRGQPHLRHGLGSYAWLDNNPGNLTGVPGGPDLGQYPDKFNWHNFLVFPDHDTGFAAIAEFLKQGPYPSLSILDAFRKYAPGGDGPNSPEQYAADVASAAGVTTDTLVGDLTDDQMAQMQTKIEQVEGSVPGDELSVDDPAVPELVRSLVTG